MEKAAAGDAQGAYFGRFLAYFGHNFEAFLVDLITVIGRLGEGLLGVKIGHFWAI